MITPPTRYRLITPNLTISAPLLEDNIEFLHNSGCRKIMTISGGFVNADVVVNLKKKAMEVTHFPLDVVSSKLTVDEKVSRIIDKSVEQLHRGSKMHIVCGAEMIEVAAITGILRRIICDWDLSSALSESLDICRFMDSEVVTSIILNTDISRWK